MILQEKFSGSSINDINILALVPTASIDKTLVKKRINLFQVETPSHIANYDNHFVNV